MPLVLFIWKGAHACPGPPTLPGAHACPGPSTLPGAQACPGSPTLPDEHMALNVKEDSTLAKFPADARTYHTV